VIEERAGDVRAANTFEEAEEPDAVVMEVVVQAVDDGADPAQNFSRLTIAGQIGFDLAVLVKRVVRFEARLDVYEQRRNPGRIRGLNLPREAQKLPKIPRRVNW
jgi:hypothetical protein